jgi:hypothetical protein
MGSSIAPPSAGLVAPQASFVHDVAGTRPLVLSPVLRQVTTEGPAGRADDLVAAGRSLAPSGPAPADFDPVPGAGAHDIRRPPPRPLAGRARSAAPARRLDAYEGELRAYERPEPQYDVWPEEWAGGEPESDGIPEELPPPIFSALLAERTGQSLADLRPDLADADGNIIDPRDTSPAPPRRRKTLAESRRAGLGVPQHSTPAGGEEAGAPGAGQQAPETASDTDDDTEVVVEILTAEELFAGRAPTPEPEPDAVEEPELTFGPPADRRPTLRFRAAPGAPVRRMPATGGTTLRQTVPTDVRQAVERATGMDPGPTAVHRGPDASVEATRIGAAAFVRDGEIFLPAEHGPLDAPATRAVLAHELTHVVQHRVYGDRLPRPDSPGGRRLEAEARSVQRWVAGVDEAPRQRTPGTAGTRPAESQLGELRETADELVASGLAHWAPDGTLVFGGGAMGGMGDPWMLPVADTLQVATAEDLDLYRKYQEQRLAGLPHEDAQTEYLEYHNEYVEKYGADLQSLAGGGAGAGAGALAGGGGTSVESLEKELKKLKAPVDPSMSYEQATKGQGWGWGKLFEDPAHAAYLNEQAAFKEKKDELQAKYDKALKDKKTHDDAAAAATATAAASTAAAQSLIHPPAGGDKKVGLEKTDAEKTDAAKKAEEPLSESKRLEQIDKDNEALWKLNQEMEKLEAGRPMDPNMSYEQAQASRGGGGWGWGSLFADPDKERAKTEQAKYAKDKKHLEDRIELQKQIEAARKKEQTEKAEKKAADDAKKKDADAKPDAKDLKAKLDAEADADLAKADEARETAEASSTEVSRLLDHLDDEDVEDLATLLYSRLVTRLRQDLIIDRERAGLLTDFR